MPIIDLQKRSRELGRIRLGVRETFTKRDGETSTRPAKLDRFRFTTNSQALLGKVADLYGGEVRPWVDGTQGFELISDATRVPIMVPPQPVSQWFEFWTRAGIQHRCDGYTNVLTDEPCDPEDPKHVEALKKPTTRLNVVLRDIEGIGVWRVETHGWNAAVELPDVAEFLAQAGGYVNGWLSLEQRTSIDNTGPKPVTRQFMVPIIEIDVTPSQLMAGHGRVAAPALAGGPVGDRPALAAGGPDYVALAADLTDAEAVRQLWRDANGAGHMTQGLSDHLARRVAEIEAGPGGQGGEGAADPSPSDAVSSPTPDGDGVVDAELVPDTEGEPDPEKVWAEIVEVGGQLAMTLPDIETDVTDFLGGTTSAEASGAELQAFLVDNLRPRLIEKAS